MRLHSFDSVAEAYTHRVSPHRHPQFLALIHELHLQGGEQVLDIGTGPGILSLEVASRINRGGFLHGLDLAPSMVALARKNAKNRQMTNISFQQGDALNLPFDNHTFDIVLSSNAFPWVKDPSRFLGEVRRVLKPGGKFGLIALSRRCYEEFARAYNQAASMRPDLLKRGRPFARMGARLYYLEELGNLVHDSGFEISKLFEHTTREPIHAEQYLDRINAIVNENYLDHLNGNREPARDLLRRTLAKTNGRLRITESSVFVISNKSGE